MDSFNPRPRVGGDGSTHDLVLGAVVSIHAPAWGATHGRSLARAKARFNPRPRVGGDFVHDCSRTTLIVSIHAPAWGATSCVVVVGIWQEFQSTPPRGGRRCARKSSFTTQSFNPRPRVGGDHPLD